LIETGRGLDWLATNEAEVRATAREIARLASQLGVDLIQLNQPALAAEPMPVPVIVVAHSCVATWWSANGNGAMPESFNWQTALVAAGLARGDRVVAPSRSFATDLVRAYGLRRTPEVVHNGRIPPSSIAESTQEAVLTAGRLWDRGKDVATIDAAAAELDVDVVAAGLTMGPHGEQIVLRHARAVGHLDDAELSRAIAARPVFISASRYEPFGLAVLEAAQAACPLVLADIPTFRELWDGVAVFVQPGQSRDFAHAIQLLIDNREHADVLGRSARERAVTLTPERTAAGMIALYDAVAHSRIAA
jgi:glycosyltransferase involved in cell wall biosynthesis